jgi:uncharacterized protein involved in tolerance to divalent cations
LDKLIAIDLILKANKHGCRLKVACIDLEVNFKTYYRWQNDIIDRRKDL